MLQRACTTGGTVDAAFTTQSGVLDRFSFGPEWDELTHVGVVSSSDMLAIDRVEVPAPGNWLLWISGKAALFGAERYRSRRRMRKAPGMGHGCLGRYAAWRGGGGPRSDCGA